MLKPKTERAKKIRQAKNRGKALQNRITRDFSIITGIPYGRDELIASREMGLGGSDVRLIGEAKQLLNVSAEAKCQKTWSAGSYIQQARSNIADVSDWVLIVRKPGHGNDPITLMDVYYITKLLDISKDLPYEVFQAKRFYLEKWVNKVRSELGKNKEWYCAIQFKNENFYFLEYKYYIKLLTKLVERRKNKISLLRGNYV